MNFVGTTLGMSLAPRCCSAGTALCPWRGLDPAAAIPLGDRSATVPDDEAGDVGIHGHVACDRFEPMPPAVIGLRTVDALWVDPLGDSFGYFLKMGMSCLAAA
jgi:hypothetical protein